MSQPEAYTPPKIWSWESDNGGKFSGINRPTAGARYNEDLPVGKHPFQLYSLATPNGVKITVMFEELLAAGHSGAEYDAWPINIGTGEQFSSGFVAVNPNSKIPALMDYSGDTPIRLFESGSMLVHLAEKFGAFLPAEPTARAQTRNWLFWLMGAAPYLGGGFGHFYSYAPEPMQYPIDRYTMEVKRQLDVLDRHLENNRYLAGDDYTIADIGTWPWYGALALGRAYDAAEFLQTKHYSHVQRWAQAINARPAVKRGCMVNSFSGDASRQLHERHDASDFEHRTADKLEANSLG